MSIEPDALATTSHQTVAIRHDTSTTITDQNRSDAINRRRRNSSKMKNAASEPEHERRLPIEQTGGAGDDAAQDAGERRAREADHLQPGSNARVVAVEHRERVADEPGRQRGCDDEATRNEAEHAEPVGAEGARRGDGEHEARQRLRHLRADGTGRSLDPARRAQDPPASPISCFRPLPAHDRLPASAAPAGVAVHRRHPVVSIALKLS